MNDQDCKRQRSSSRSDVTCTPFRRSVPHVRGNWAGHVYISLGNVKKRGHAPSANVDESSDGNKGKVNDDDKVDRTSVRLQAVVQETLVNRSVKQFQKELEKQCEHPSSDVEAVINASAGGSNTTAILLHDHLHVSLSRPFYLQVGSIESFVKDLRQELSHLPSFSFIVQPYKPKLLVNDEGSRSFWCWPIASQTALTSLVSSVNDVLTKYRQPTYYESPHFHVSIASVVGDWSNAPPLGSKCVTESEHGDEESDGEEEEGDFLVTCKVIHCQFGSSKFFRIKLAC